MTKNFKRIFSLSVVCALLLFLIASCGPNPSAENSNPPANESVAPSPAETDDVPSGEPVTLTFWHTYSEGAEEDFMNAAIAAFEDANPGITINPIRMPLDGLQQQVITSASGDAAPDVMRMDLTWVSGFAKLGALQDLTGFDGFDALKGNVQEASMATNYYDGSYYGFPLNATTTVSVWNMDLLKEFGLDSAPTTINELVEAAKAHNDPTNEKYLFTIAGTYNWATLPYFWSLGGSLTDDNYSVASGYLNSDASVAALETLAEWYNDGIISHAIIGEEPSAWGGMTTGGNYAMISEGPWFFTSTEVDFETQTTLMPAGEGGSVSIVGGENIVMFKNSKHQEEAWKFIQFMLSDEVQMTMIDAGMIPSTQSAADQMDTSNYPWLDAYLEQLGNAKARTPSANWGDIETVLDTAFETVIRGEAGAKETLDQAATQIDELLK